MLFITYEMLSKCFDYDILLSECLDKYEECLGWSSENYTTLDAVWRCLNSSDIDKEINKLKKLLNR